MNQLKRSAIAVAAVVMGLTMRGWAQTAPSVSGKDPSAQAQQVIDKAIEYLKSQQKPDGSWQKENEPVGITALVLKAVVQGPKSNAQTPWVRKGFEKLLSYQWESGGVYKDSLANYNTAVAISAMAAVEDPQYKAAMDKAVAYLKQLQWTEKTEAGPKGEKVTDDKNPWYGGWGYGRSARPDASNTQLAVDALKDAGLKPDDPAYQAALKFATRMQNLSETNDQKWAGNDGGFVYTPANNGESFAGEFTTPDGQRRLRSYGSMTYAGLKTMVYAGLTKDDPRVKAAWNWITKHWTLDENPGMAEGDAQKAQHGLYYYYLTLSRSLNAYDEPVVTAPNGKHDWRVELIEKLASLQHPDGSFVGDARWMENNPILVTSYAALALEEAQKDLKEHPAK